MGDATARAQYRLWDLDTLANEGGPVMAVGSWRWVDLYPVEALAADDAYGSAIGDLVRGRRPSGKPGGFHPALKRRSSSPAI